MTRRLVPRSVIVGCFLLVAAGGCAGGPRMHRADLDARGAQKQVDEALPPSYSEPQSGDEATSESDQESPPAVLIDEQVDEVDPPTTAEVLPPPLARNSDNIQPLLLEEVVSSVNTSFPLLLAVLQEQGITSGQLLAAQGAFDLNLRAREFGQVGTFDSQRLTVGVDQNLAQNGVAYFGGYRHSVGDFPIYYGDRKTGDGGEFRAGVLIPLLAGRDIDKRRATLQQAAISRMMADPVIVAQRLDFVRAASRAYWTWVATGRRYQVAASVLKIAEDRDLQLAEQVQRGAVAEIERTDNQRVIVERQLRLIAAERAWQQASLTLSLYLRGPDGDPEIPSAQRLPKDVPEPQPADRANLANDIELALRQRPELRRLRLQRERAGVDFELAQNQMLPSVNLGLEGFQDVGAGASFSKTPLVKGTELDRTTYVASLQFDLPLQRRDARGRALTARSTLVQLSYQEQFQRDRIATELQDAASARDRSYELLQKARENVAVARKVESGEQERFTRGQGTIVILNFRELVAAEASFAEVDALAEYYRSLADYQAALGMGADLPEGAGH